MKVGTPQRRNAYHCLLESHPKFWSDAYGDTKFAVAAAAMAFVGEGGRFLVHESRQDIPLDLVLAKTGPVFQQLCNAANNRLCRRRKNYKFPRVWAFPIPMPRDTHPPPPGPGERHLVAILPRPVDGGMVFDGIRPKVKPVRLPTPPTAAPAKSMDGGMVTGASPSPARPKGKARRLSTRPTAAKSADGGMMTRAKPRPARPKSVVKDAPHDQSQRHAGCPRGQLPQRQWTEAW
jgi:hypothetical protein